ncbi:hypothetical protein RhiirB3_453548 [Rhizophagus irregularis]|nr:hypothetical protein RhiirB3_453548 [Rhizophagus irregularis]
MRGISFLMGWTHGKEIRVYGFEFNSFVLGDFSRWGMRFRWEGIVRVELNQVPVDWIKDEYPPYDTFVLLKTEFNNLSFDISSMTWVIVRHLTRKFLVKNQLICFS